MCLMRMILSAPGRSMIAIALSFHACPFASMPLHPGS
jgi:hypothetical protein